MFNYFLSCDVMHCLFVFFFKQKTAYEMRISDWSSDVCSSDLSRVVGKSGKAIAAAWNLVRGLPVREIGRFDGVRALRSRAVAAAAEIGRASCRERVCQYV